MPSISTYAALAALVSYVAAVPLLGDAVALPPVDLKKLKIKQIARGKFFKNGALQTNATYAKYAQQGAIAPIAVLAAAADAEQQQGSVAANPTQYDERYLSPVTLGDSEVMLAFDTGSADLWAFSTDMPVKQTKNHAVYNTSTGTKLDGYRWRILYGDASGASGNVYTDKVVVGGVTATAQAVEAATAASLSFRRDKEFDGIMGLAFSKLNQVKPKKQLTFFDSIRRTLPQQVFTANLKKNAPGTYTFGYLDDTVTANPLSYVPVDQTGGLWQFQAGSYAIGNASTAGSIGTSIADTATTLIYVPQTIADEYWSQVTGGGYDSSQAGYTFPCAESANLPDFTVQIGDGTYTIPGSYLNYAPRDKAGVVCFGGLQRNNGFPWSIFGDVFLKTVYAVFDRDTNGPRLGFAPKL